MGFLGFKLYAPCFSPIVKLNNFFLRDIMYLVYNFMRCRNSSFIGLDCCVTMGADGGRDVPGVVVTYGRS